MPLTIEEAEREAREQTQRLNHARWAWLLFVQNKGPAGMGRIRELLGSVGNFDIDVQQAFWQLEGEKQLEQRGDVVMLTHSTADLAEDGSQLHEHTLWAWLLLMYLGGPIGENLGCDWLMLIGNPHNHVRDALEQLKTEGKLDKDRFGLVRPRRPLITFVD